MTARRLETLFCDDIRHEIGGKLSLIGVYSAVLLVREFPVTLPKLCLSIKLVTPADSPIQTLTLRVLRDDETLQELVVSDTELETLPDVSSDSEESQERTLVMQMLLVFSPLRFDRPGILRVHAQTEAEELRGIGLLVGTLPTATESNSAPGLD
jgi:hypothetical protein